MQDPWTMAIFFLFLVALLWDDKDKNPLFVAAIMLAAVILFIPNVLVLITPMLPNLTMLLLVALALFGFKKIFSK